MNAHVRSLQHKTAQPTFPAMRARTRASTVPPIVDTVLRSPGQALDAGTRTLMESRFGHTFSQVRVHADAQAAESARAVNALAYTVGRDVVFGGGQYAPETRAGQQLLAHELTHVVQQSGATPANDLQMGAANDALEQEADRTAVSAAPRSGVSRVQRSLIQRQVLQGEGAGLTGLGLGGPGLTSLNLPVQSLEIAAGETLSTQNPKLMQIAQAFKSIQGSSPGAYVKLSADLTEGAQLSDKKASDERSQLSGRLFAARDALQSLGVPKDQITIQPPTAFSTSAHGQLAVDVFKSRPALPILLPPGPATGKPTPAAPKSTGGLPSLSDLLTLKFGPVTVELPKSVAAKLPIPITAGKTLVIDLKAEVPGSFSFSISLDGLQYVRVSLKAGLTYDKDKGVGGSAGIQIQTTRKVCHAANPEELKTKITEAGEKLKKAMQEYSAESDKDKKLMKLPDIGSALGDMYDAVDKSKAKCEDVPTATFEFGAKGPLGGGTETDPSKREQSYIGGTLTIPF